jgi:hypothetical protein
VDKSFVYFAMGFALGVEYLNIAMRRKSKNPVKLKDEHLP